MNNIEWTSIIETFIGTFGGAALAFGSSIFIDYLTRKKNREERIQMLLLMIQENAYNIKNISNRLVRGIKHNNVYDAIAEIRDEKSDEYRLYLIRDVYDKMLHDIFKSCKDIEVRSAIKQIVELQYFLYQKLYNSHNVDSKLDNEKLKDGANSIILLIRSHDDAMRNIESYISQNAAKIDASK